MKVFSKITLSLIASTMFLSTLASAETRHFDMTIEEVTINVTETFKAKVWAYNGQVPGPLLRVTEGDKVVVTVVNNTTINHTIHWHGIYQTGSWRSDGVPDVTQKGIEPGESYTYSFIADKIGTLWYHCHVNVPEHVGLRGMWGPFIVDPLEPVAIEKEVTKEAILMFTGWTPEVAESYGKGGHPNEPISYFSVNGKAFPETQPLRVKKGDVVRLRLIAASVDVAFHPHGHDMLVTHKDGLPLEHPYAVDVLSMAPGERYDVIIKMNNPGRWIAHDHIEHHVSNNGKAPGGSVFIIEYESITRDDDWYVWKNKNFQDDFYFTKSMTKGPGMFDVPEHEGEYPEFER